MLFLKKFSYLLVVTSLLLCCNSEEEEVLPSTVTSSKSVSSLFKGSIEARRTFLHPFLDQIEFSSIPSFDVGYSGFGNSNLIPELTMEATHHEFHGERNLIEISDGQLTLRNSVGSELFCSYTGIGRHGTGQTWDLQIVRGTGEFELSQGRLTVSISNNLSEAHGPLQISIQGYVSGINQ
jgi:hypothetical protein